MNIQWRQFVPTADGNFEAFQVDPNTAISLEIRGLSNSEKISMTRAARPGDLPEGASESEVLARAALQEVWAIAYTNDLVTGSNGMAAIRKCVRNVKGVFDADGNSVDVAGFFDWAPMPIIINVAIQILTIGNGGDQKKIE